MQRALALRGQRALALLHERRALLRERRVLLRERRVLLRERVLSPRGPASRALPQPRSYCERDLVRASDCGLTWNAASRHSFASYLP
jgi:hypothetical protein